MVSLESALGSPDTLPVPASLQLQLSSKYRLKRKTLNPETTSKKSSP